MNYYAVSFIDATGGLVTRTIRAWHAAAAERTCCHLFGGSFHSATTE